MAEPSPRPLNSYRVLREARHETLRIRGLDMHLRSWGPPPRADEPRWLLLHGYQDTGDTFQFLADAFERDWPLTALDWRGFGLSEWGQNGYWFHDYLADLDALLDVLCGDGPVRMVGHSMGGNIASLYAGVRPQRVRSLVNLEGFGMPRTAPDRAPAQLGKWLDQVKSIPPLKDYESFDQLASIIRHRYPRFGEARAEFVAHAWGRLEADGRVHLLGDPRHRWVNPTLYQREDAAACWRRISAPVLMVVGELSDYLPRLGADGAEGTMRSIIQDVEIARVAGAGHMLHIEQPEIIAARIERFSNSH
ncbi:MAG: alpha/beta hydrolase [Steroidobacteraceae bacterium]|jgi:pimeloyl-ACP methyl ester carboxylesterase